VVRFAVPPVSAHGPSVHSTKPSVVALIPARYDSTRLPGKVLADVYGKPLIEHVYRQVSRASSVGVVMVATDDQRILDAVEKFGGRGRLTRKSHESGTDRIAEIAEGLTADLIVNVQADEPLIAPLAIDDAIEAFKRDPSLQMSTLRRRIHNQADLHNPNIVKVVCDADGHALYFSRAPIPYTREGCPPAPLWRHIGLYVYRRECLIELTKLPQTAMERTEALEQLRAVENGIRIRAVETTFDSIGVDTPEDLERVRRIIATNLSMSR
jgi:3-deoxy-manno-octulosonate cytidylyltransferase (CMP-KDO synthetase)